MSASVEELRADLRETAVKKRAAHFDVVAKPADLASVLAALNETLQGIAAILAQQQAGPPGPAQFTITERDAAGKPKWPRSRP